MGLGWGWRDTFATSKSHLRHKLIRQLTETQNTEKKISYCVTKGSATHWKGLQKQNWKSYKQNSNTFGVSSRNLTLNTWQASIINKTTSSSKKSWPASIKSHLCPHFNDPSVAGNELLWWDAERWGLQKYMDSQILSFIFLSLFKLWRSHCGRALNAERPPLSNFKGKITHHAMIWYIMVRSAR